ncbi:MAG: hypothetical protein B7C24_02280 [Bacteroidetes bacterium 4572_77]|nr:MAG: hypothetical protein B7C24_02280 [Bacteroidetes bacterium 4572_77]
MHINRIIVIILVLIPFSLFSQEKTEKVKLNWRGFVKADYIFDSRQNYEGREGFFIAYPKPIDLDADGHDKNAYPSANQYGMTTRLGLDALGPQIFNAKVSASIEGDFTGPSNAHNNAFRLRHAYIKLQWENASFLMGQYWHPLNVPEMMPQVLSLNMGAPMHAFSRGPQIRLTQKMGALKWIAVAFAQRDYASNGPQGVSSIYLRNSVIPDLSLQLQYERKGVFAGFGGNFKQLDFKTYTIDNKLLHDKLASFAAIAFLKFESKKWDLRVQTVWGQNLYDQIMLGGVAVAQVDSMAGNISYTNLASASAWSSINYKYKNWKFGIFGGFTKTLGASTEINGAIYARGYSVHHVYRISPQWSYKIKNLIIANEWEYTVAAYGDPDSYAKVKESYSVANLRFTLSLIYLI